MAHVADIEWQKREFAHAHILLFMDDTEQLPHSHGFMDTTLVKEDSKKEAQSWEWETLEKNHYKPQQNQRKRHNWQVGCSIQSNTTAQVQMLHEFCTQYPHCHISFQLYHQRTRQNQVHVCCAWGSTWPTANQGRWWDWKIPQYQMCVCHQGFVEDLPMPKALDTWTSKKRHSCCCCWRDAWRKG